MFYIMLFLCFDTDESYFNDTIEIALPQNVVPGSVYAVVSTVGKYYTSFLFVAKFLSLMTFWVIAMAFCISFPYFEVCFYFVRWSDGPDLECGKLAQTSLWMWRTKHGELCTQYLHHEVLVKCGTTDPVCRKQSQEHHDNRYFVVVVANKNFS